MTSVCVCVCACGVCGAGHKLLRAAVPCTSFCTMLGVRARACVCMPASLPCCIDCWRAVFARLVPFATVSPPFACCVHVQVSAAVAAFLRKVAKLSASRIEFLCDKLELSEVHANEAWTTMLHILEMRLGVMRDQHLDRIILCIIYGVCKVNEMDKRFSHIIDKYKELRTDATVMRIIHNIPMSDMVRGAGACSVP